MLETLSNQLDSNRKNLTEERRRLLQSLTHLQKTDSINSPGAIITRRPWDLVNLLDSVCDRQHLTRQKFMAELLDNFGDLLLEGENQRLSAYFTPAAGATPRPPTELLKKSRTPAILWASRDGFCNAYWRHQLEDGWNIFKSKQKLCWETDNSLANVLPVLDYLDDKTLLQKMTIYHCELLSRTGPKATTSLLDDLIEYLDPASGAHFDLWWNRLEAFIPAGGFRFITHRLPKLALGPILKEATAIQDDTLLKKILLADDEATAETLLGKAAGSAVTLKEIYLHLSDYFSKIRWLFHEGPGLILDGWFNASRFRTVIDQAGFLESLPALSNALTPWHRIVMGSGVKS